MKAISGKCPVGFTLIELLCAMAVLSLVLVLVLQTVSSALNWASSTRSVVNSGTEARDILQRLNFDMNSRISMPVSNLSVTKQAGNDVLEILADVRNTSSTARFAKISYQVGTEENVLTGRDEPMLFRSLTPVKWTDDPAATIATPSSPTLADVFSDHCFRIETAFVLKDGSLTNVMPSDLSTVKAIIVGLAVLDAEHRARLTDAEITQLASKLEDVPAGKTPLEVWKAADFSRKESGQVRFYQQTFYLKQNLTAQR